MTESITYTYYAQLMNRIGGWLVKNKPTYKKRSIYGSIGRVADLGTLERVLLERYNKGEWNSDDLGAEYVECAIFDNTDLSFLPNYVTAKDGNKIYKNEIIDMANRVSAYEILNGQHPRIIYRNPKADTDDTYNYFCKVFGKVNTIDDALAKVQGRGYGYYYNSAYNNKEAINRMKNGSGVNCTDSAQVFYRIAEKLGYKVQFVHVLCRGGDGHVRLRLDKGNGWFYRDPAAVLDGEAITSNWCNPPAQTIAYDPAWIFTDLDK